MDNETEEYFRYATRMEQIDWETIVALAACAICGMVLAGGLMLVMR